MNHAGEITPLTRLVRPHVAIVTTVEPVHLEFFASVEAIADAKAEIFLGARAGRRGGPQSRQPAVSRGSSATPPQRACARRRRSARTPRADARLLKCALQPEGSTVEASILGDRVTYKLGAPGRHLVMNSLAVLAAASLAAPISPARRSRSAQPGAGRRTRHPHRARTAGRSGAR